MGEQDNRLDSDRGGCVMIQRKGTLVLLFMVFVFALSHHGTWAGVLIKKVAVDDQHIDTQKRTHAIINWELTEPGVVSLLICNLKGQIIQTIIDKEQHAAGSYAALWDGRNIDGVAVENGIYFPIIRSKSNHKGTDTYNPSSFSWGEEVLAEDLEYDPRQKLIRFSLQQSVYGRLRAGLKEGGPVYKTIAPWRHWGAGYHKIAWNGKDASNLKRIVDQKNISYSFDAFTLPENAITVAGSPQQDYSSEEGGATFPVHPPHGGQLSFFSLEASSQGAEPILKVRWKRNAKRLKGKAVCTVDFANPEKRSSALNGTSELILYIDDVYVTELPITAFPASIGFDTTAFSNGKHIVAINLLTADDRAGIDIHAITIKN